MNEDVIEDLFNEYGDDVSTYLFYCTRSSDVEDMVQETFLRALRSWHSFRQESSPKTWLFSIARRVASDFQRDKVKIARSMWDVKTIASLTDGPEIVAERNETVRRVLEFVHRMKPAYRDVIVLRFVMDMSITATSKILGWSESRVKVTQHRALREVRSALQPLMGGSIDVPSTKR